MKKHSFLLITIAFFYTQNLHAQSKNLKWGKFSSEELSITSSELDTTANAIILGEYGHIKVNYGNIHIDTHVRIKILNTNGFNEADITLPYYFFNDLENINTVKAQTINQLPNGKIQKIEIKKNQVYTIDIDDRWKAKRFTFPSIQEGSIIEYRYTKVSKNYYYLDDWYFQKEQPVLYSELEINFPEVLEYSSYMFGHKLIKKYRGNATNKFILTNMPPIQDQKFVYNIDNYCEKIRFQLEAYYKRDNYNGLTKVDVLQSWEELTKEIVEDFEYGTFKKAKKHYAEVLDQLDISDQAPIVKLETIYNYITSTFRWNEKNGIYNQKFKDFVEEKTGNTADINLYFVNLLKAAGIKANPMLISTRSHGNMFKKHPLLSQFNRMIAYAELANGSYVMNAINPQRPYKIPGLNDYVNEGFVLRDKNPGWVKITPEHKSRVLYLIDVTFDEDGKAHYQISTNLNGYDALLYRTGINSNGNDYIYNQIKNRNISRSDSLIIENQDDNIKPLNFVFGYRENESSMVNNEIIYFNPFIIDDFQNNPFNEERRNFPIELPYESNFAIIMNMFIPEGFEVVGIPKSEKFNLPNKAGMFAYQNKYFDDKIQVSIKIQFLKRKLSKEYNGYLMEFYDILIEKINEQIVMKRKVS